MPMSRRHFAWLYQLKGEEHRMAGHLGFLYARIDQTNDPSLYVAARYGNFFLRLK